MPIIIPIIGASIWAWLFGTTGALLGGFVVYKGGKYVVGKVHHRRFRKMFQKNSGDIGKTERDIRLYLYERRIVKNQEHMNLLLEQIIPALQMEAFKKGYSPGKTTSSPRAETAA
jgi:hypothetical protein